MTIYSNWLPVDEVREMAQAALVEPVYVVVARFATGPWRIDSVWTKHEPAVARCTDLCVDKRMLAHVRTVERLW